MIPKKICIACILFLSAGLALFANGRQEQARTKGSGKGASITIKVPKAEGLTSPGLSDIHIRAYRRLLHNFSKYSALTVGPDFEFDTSTYDTLLSGYYDDNDEAGRDLGHLSAPDYLMTGSITTSPLGYHFYLQVAKTTANEKSVPFVFSQNCTFTELADLSIVDRASLYLLEQMGVKLSGKERTELEGVASANKAKGQTIMKEAVAAQQAGDDAKARMLLNQAKELDAQLAAEAERRLSEMDKPLAMLSATTIPPPAPLPPPQLQPFVPIPEKQAPPARTTGNLGNDARARQRAYEIEQDNERIRKEVEAENARIRAENERRQKEVEAENERRRKEVEAENERRRKAVEAENTARDAHNKEIWVKILRDTEEYYRNYFTANPPVELVYENKIEELAWTQDFNKRTISAKFNAALVPVESGWARAVENTVNDLRKQLLATDRAWAWGLADWPQTAVTSPSPFSSRTESVQADARLLDENGRVLGRQSFLLVWKLTANFSGKGISLGIDLDSLQSSAVIFENIKIDDITDTLQIRIARINEQTAETAAAQGGIQYSTDWQKWRRIEQGQQSREAARKRQAATDKFLRRSGIGLGGWAGFGVGTVLNLGGGGEIELRLSRYFGLQTGFTFFTEMKIDDTPSETTDIQIKADTPTKTINIQDVIQIPVLAKFIIKNYFSSDDLGLYLSPYGGIGINIISTGNDVSIQSPSHFSFIAGGELGMWGGGWDSISGEIFVAYKYNRDFSDTTYHFSGENFSYLGERHIIYAGVRLFIPFRKK